MKKSKEEFYSTQKSVFYYISHYREADPVLSSFHDFFNGRYTQRLIEDVSLREKFSVWYKTDNNVFAC